MVRFSLMLVGIVLTAWPVLAADTDDDLAGSAPLGMENVVPLARDRDVPRARWEFRPNGTLWTRVAMSAVQGHGAALIDTVPKDIAEWCPAYPDNSREDRAAFWVGFVSALARYESRWNQRAVGGNGRWFGLMQIYPPTAEYRDCRVQSGQGLLHGPDNLSCAVRIMAITVPRDQAISVKDTRWRGVAADWGPMRTDWMRRDMQAYTKRQSYCRLLSEVRPHNRPGGVPEGIPVPVLDALD